MTARGRGMSAWVLPTLVVLATFAAFLPVLQNGFVDYDDRENIYENPDYRGIGPARIIWAFTTMLRAHYQPLSWVSLGLDYTVWGMNPYGYHLTNLLLHAASALIFYFVCRRLLRLASPPPLATDPAALTASAFAGTTRAPREESGFAYSLGAAVAALVFAIHPLRVESVAWVTERRDVLCGVFFLLAILMYLRAPDEHGAERSRAVRWALVLHALALLSKVLAVTLPAVLLLLDVYPRRRLPADPRRWSERGSGRLVSEKIPFFLLSAIFAAIAPIAQRTSSSIEWVAGYGFLARLATPLYGLAIYLWKTIVPTGLSPLYPVPVPFDPFEDRFLIAAAAVAAIAAVVWLLRHRAPALAAAGVYYAIVLFPMLGFVQIGVQIAADRFSYLPSLGIAALAGGAVMLVWRASEESRLPREAGEAALACAAVVVFLLGARTFGQCFAWRDSVTLWKQALFVDPTVPELQNWIGLSLRDAGRIPEAIEHYREALRLREGYTGARVNLANALVINGQDEDAIEEFKRSESMAAEVPEALHNWGLAYVRTGRPADAVPRLASALALRPSMVMTSSLLASAYLDTARAGDALRVLQDGISYGPPTDDLSARLAAIGQADESAKAVALLEEASRRYPDDEGVKIGLALARSRQGAFEAAAGILVEAIARKPSSLRPYQELADLCLQADLYLTASEVARTALGIGARNDDLVTLAQRAEQGMASRREALGAWMTEASSGRASRETLVQIAAAQFEAGRGEDARRTAEGILVTSRAAPAPAARWILDMATGRAPDPRSSLPRGGQR